jgi:hypothetical protein
MMDQLETESINDLVERLRRIGVAAKLGGDIAADLGDLRDALVLIAHAYDLISSGKPPGPLLDEIESEARDHMPNHVRSLLSTTEAIRREWKGARRYVERDELGKFRKMG